MMLKNWFRRERDPIRDAARAQVSTWTRHILSLREDDGVSVNEIICADPACPGTETIILVMSPKQRTVAYKVKGDVNTLAYQDIVSVLCTGQNS